MTRTKLLTWSAALAMAIPVLVAAPASAHSTCVKKQNRGEGCVSASHTWVTACDTNAEGWGVRTNYVTSRGVRGLVGDANGSKPGCGGEAPTGGGTIVRYQVCAGPDGANRDCSSWVNA